MVSCGDCEIFMATCFEEHRRTAASGKTKPAKKKKRTVTWINNLKAMFFKIQKIQTLTNHFQKINRLLCVKKKLMTSHSFYTKCVCANRITVILDTDFAID